MLKQDQKSLLLEAKSGNKDARNQIIANHEPFILLSVQSFLKKRIDKSNDMYSEALIAFNEAIDKYDVTLDTSFEAFAKRHIRFRLLDYLKKENKHHHLPFEVEADDGSSYSPAEIEKLESEMGEKREKERRGMAFQIFFAKLRDFQIEPHVLATSSPKHTDTKQMLKTIIEETSKNDELVSYIKQKKKLPISKISKLTDVPKKTIDNHRRYIIAHLLILTESELFPLRHFLTEPVTKEG
jgi:RNA polymerase sigma factor